jgi:hypothetical protein
MKKSLLTLATLAALFFSSFSSASTIGITGTGYSLNTDTNIVTGGGLEWLRWDQTVGQSINSALTNYSADGWRLATNTEMATLLNTWFNRWSIDPKFTASENITQQYNLDKHYTGSSPADYFFLIFGRSYFDSTYISPFEGIKALYGADLNGNNKYNKAEIQDSWIYSSTSYGPGFVKLNWDGYSPEWELNQTGVALVRDIQISSVPVPASAFMFAPALLGFLALRRKLRA